jgi:hypothetical protein
LEATSTQRVFWSICHRKCNSIFFLENACEAIDKLPGVLKRNGVGRSRFDSRSRIIAVLVKAWLGRSYRDTEAYLYDNKETLAKFSIASARPQHHLENNGFAA